jgi:hypothetical protein
MSADDLQGLVAIAGNVQEPPDVRIAAIRQLADLDDEAALATLIRLSTEPDPEPPVRGAIAESLAVSMVRQGLLGSQENDLLPFYAWSDELFEVYDKTVAKLQRKTAR